MAEFTIPENDRRRRIAASAGQTALTYDFPIFDEDHIAVTRLRSGTETLLTITTDYTVSGVASSNGGAVTLVSAAQSGDIYILDGDVPAQRLTDYVTRGSFLASTVNRETDLIWLAIQERVRDAGRALHLPVSDADARTAELPLAADRAGMILSFDANGDPVATIDADGLDTLAGLTTEISALAAISADITTVAGIDAEVTTLAGLDTEIAALYAIRTDISAVAAIDTEVGTVAGISTEVQTVAGDAADIATVAGLSADIQAVAAIDTDVSTVAGIGADVTTVAGIAADVSAVAGGSYSVAALTDVTLTTLAAGEILFSTSGSAWANRTLAEAGIFETANAGGLATQDTINNADWSGTALAIANGGTGSTTASAARTALGLAIGSDVQAHDPLLDDIAAITPATGQILYVDGSSNLVALAAGSDDEVLTLASGVPTWAAASGSSLGWTHIQTQAASADTAIDFALPSGYRSFRLTIDVVASSSGANLDMRVSTDGGSTFISSASSYYAGRIEMANTSTVAGTGSIDSTEMALATDLRNDTSNFVMVNLGSPRESGTQTSIFATTSGGRGGVVVAPQMVVGNRRNAEDNDAIRVFVSSGNFTGNLTLEGLKTS